MSTQLNLLSVMEGDVGSSIVWMFINRFEGIGKEPNLSMSLLIDVLYAIEVGIVSSNFLFF